MHKFDFKLIWPHSSHNLHISQNGLSHDPHQIYHTSKPADQICLNSDHLIPTILVIAFCCKGYP